MEKENSGIPIGESIALLMNRVLLFVFIIPCGCLIASVFFDSLVIPVGLAVPFLVLPILVFTLNSRRKFELSKFLGLLGYNIAVFLVASSESLSTGVYFHFVSCCAVTMALYKYSDRWKSILFVSLSMFFLLAVNLRSFTILPFREYGKEWEKIFLVIHTISAAIISCYSFFTVVGVNYKAKQKLNAKQQIIEAQNNELRKTNRELDKFVYSASHDLRAPLTSIKGLVNLMEMDAQTPPQEYMSKIKEQILKMETFMHDVVDYSRNARVEVKIEDINLFDKVNDVIRSLSYFDHAAAISFEININPYQMILSDSYRLSVILNNLISNAIKYMDDRKKNPFVKVSYRKVFGYPTIYVEDNGIGIAPDHLPKVFDMFYRATAASNGSGLGLYIAMESAQKMNYKINVQSTINEGTVFTIKLPEYAGQP